MSLTVLVDEEQAEVGVVRWFLDAKASASYAVGPLMRMSVEGFRAVGWDFVRRHFRQYAWIRVAEGKVTPVCESKSEQDFLKNCAVVRIQAEESGHFTFIPQKLTEHTLGGLENLSLETHRTIPANSPEIFWKTFDEALAAAKAEG